MAWKATLIVDQREEFVRLARVPGANVSQLCERFEISRTTGHKWLARFAAAGRDGLRDRSRRPKHSPGRTVAEVEQRVAELRREHPAWGGRKLRKRLSVLQGVAVNELPVASTITEILRRHQLLDAAESAQRQPFTRFERPWPNDLWQMDFKGHFAVTRGGRCHPLTVLDDHSRFVVALRACQNEQAVTVQGALTDVFRRYGLPNQMLCDNGPPWGDSGLSSFTGLGVWLLRLGIAVTHGRPYHPQTQGKDERFHRTLKRELLCRMSAVDVAACQPQFDRFRDEYNHERPHEALNLETPISRYQVSQRVFPERLPLIEYGSDLIVRKVSTKGWLTHSRPFNVGQAFEGLVVGLRPAPEGPDGWIEVRFCQHRLGYLNLNDPHHDRLIRHREPQSTL